MACSLVFLRWEVGFAVLDDQVQVDANERGQHDGQYPDMGGEEALKGQGT
jgi:hypothetical protein